jgi:hypothetical protein
MTIAEECLNEIRKVNEDGKTDKENKVQESDADAIYGQHIAAEVRKINNELVKQLVKSEIQNTILKAHMGYFNNINNVMTQPSPTMNQYTPSWQPAQHGNRLSSLSIHNMSVPSTPNFKNGSAYSELSGPQVPTAEVPSAQHSSFASVLGHAVQWTASMSPVAMTVNSDKTQLRQDSTLLRTFKFALVLIKVLYCGRRPNSTCNS